MVDVVDIIRTLFSLDPLPLLLVALIFTFLILLEFLFFINYQFSFRLLDWKYIFLYILSSSLDDIRISSTSASWSLSFLFSLTFPMFNFQTLNSFLDLRPLSFLFHFSHFVTFWFVLFSVWLYSIRNLISVEFSFLNLTSVEFSFVIFSFVTYSTVNGVAWVF